MSSGKPLTTQIDTAKTASSSSPTTAAIMNYSVKLTPLESGAIMYEVNDGTGFRKLNFSSVKTSETPKK